MDLAPKTIVITVAAMVFLAIVLDLLRRRKRNRYEKLQMSSRDLQRSTEPAAEDDPFGQSQFPSGRSRVVGVRNAESAPATAHAESTQTFSPSHTRPQPQQGSLWADAVDGAGGNSAGDSAGNNEEAATDPQESAKTASSSAAQSATNESEAPQEVLVINLVANKGESCSGKLLLDQAVSLDMRYGAMKIFHRHRDQEGSGPVLFSMANLHNPGTFDLNTLGDNQCVGVTLFMTPEDLEQPLQALDLMLQTAQQLAAELEFNMLDESRSSMTKQTIDHYRQRAQKSTLQH